jgi:hypothetical protein
MLGFRKALLQFIDDFHLQLRFSDSARIPQSGRGAHCARPRPLV